MRVKAGPSALFSIGSTVVLVALVIGIAGSLLMARSQSAADQLQAVEPRFARLLGLQGERRRFEQALAQTTEILQEEAYAADLGSGRVGADMQQKLRAASESAGFTVVSSRIETVFTHDGFEEIPLSLRLEGTLQNLESMLQALPALRPALHLRSLSVTAVSRRRARARDDALRVEMVVAAARLTS